MGYKNKDQQREYQRTWIAKRRSEYLKDKKCVNCGSKESLQVDHIDPTQKWKHRIWSYSFEKINKELEKCQILCANCHYKKTAKDVREMKEKAHGTLRGYRNFHCRCSKCMKFKNISPLDEVTAGINPEDAVVV